MKNKLHNTLVMTAAFAFVLVGASQTQAQGQIFGFVTNSDASTPANGEIIFVGYMDNTDEEIRIDGCVGAGYDNGNWFDDFRNYFSMTLGDLYDFHFFNTANSEGFVLSGTVPSDGFLQVNITLAPVSWPAAPSWVGGEAEEPNTVVLSWSQEPGHTYHVYRRAATSNGSLFRLDSPEGSLADPGIDSDSFVDNTVDGVSDYDYLLIAENASGNLGIHSEILTVSSAPANEPPSTPVCISPPDPSGLPTFDMLQTFLWSESVDPDPGDEVLYTFMIATDSEFNTAVAVDSLVYPEHTPTVPLEFATHYWWKVSAFDKTGLSTESVPVDFWTWVLADFDHSHQADISDVVYMVEWMFNFGPPVEPLFVADLTGDCIVDISDMVFLVEYSFNFGPPPVPGCTPPK